MTKPGYGIIAECVANDTAIVYTSRGHFVEYDVLVREMPRWLRCGFISNEDLLAGRWQAVLDETLALPAPPETIGVDGAERAAEITLQHAVGAHRVRPVRVQPIARLCGPHVRIVRRDPRGAHARAPVQVDDCVTASR